MSTSTNDMQQQFLQKLWPTIQNLMAQRLAQSQRVSNVQDIDWSKASSDDLEKSFQAALNQQKQTQLNSRLIMANQLQGSADRSPDRGQSVPTGSVYLPPNPLSTALGIASRLHAMSDQSNAESGLADIDTQNSSLPAMFRRIFQQRRKAAASTLSPNAESYDVPDAEEDY